MKAPDLSRLRAAHTASLTARCDIRRKTPATNDAGGPADTWSVVAAEVPCRLMPERSRRVIEAAGGRESGFNYYRLSLPWDADIRPDDEVHIEGRTYQVVSLWDAHTLRTARRAVLADVR
ncbi:MAG: DUF6093 family protein [Anaerolineales bacterium]